MITVNNTVVKIRTDNTDGKGVVSLSAEKDIKLVRFVVTEKTGKVYSFSFVGNGKTARGEFTVENPLLWSVSQPDLYTYLAEIEYTEGVETASGCFAFRKLSTDGKNIYLNGRKLYVRGYIRGATAHEHGNTCNLSEEEYYRKNILAAKKFGFNFVRFHSTIPNETYFKVADELGILVHIELRRPDDAYNNLEEMLQGKRELVSNEFIKETVDRLHNHPSLAVYCIGNELKNGDETRIEEIGKFIKQTDDSRLYIDTCAWGANGRATVDMDVQHMSYYFPFGKHADMYENTDNLLVCGLAGGGKMTEQGENSDVLRTLHFDVPLLAHEVCHYTALRDFRALKEKFLRYGTPCPWWVDEELKMIEAKGFADSFDEMYKASKHFQRECWKTAFEAIRSTSLLAGFHFLQFADTETYENSNGVVDCFDDESYIESKDFLTFNADEVLLAKFDFRLYSAGETLTVPVSFSAYGERKRGDAEFIYTLTDTTGKSYASGKMEKIDISRQGLFGLCKVRISLPEVKTATALTFKAALVEQGATVAENSWNIWVYPKTETLSYKQFVSYENGKTMITDDIERAFDGLKQGKNVCLIYRQPWTRHVLNKTMPPPNYAFKASWNRFKPVIWDRGTNFGGICEDGLLTKYGFTTGRYYDFNYSKITEDCDKINLDDFPVKVRSILSGIDKSSRDRFDAYKVSFNLPELMYDRTLRNFSYLFEVKVGEGNLLVCGMNLTGLDEKEPSTAAFAEFLINYISSAEFAPTDALSLEALQTYMSECAKKPVKERMMTQFWALDDAPVESKRYWEESRAYLLEE